LLFVIVVVGGDAINEVRRMRRKRREKENSIAEQYFPPFSSFANTDLDYQLRKRGISKVVFAGLVANTCIESTARYAYEL
jgi:nicotinamidase-related amidase